MTIQILLLLLISLVGGIYDLKYRRIPNWLTLGTFLILLLFNISLLKSDLVLNCLLGFFVGILILIVPYLMGGMGAGDVKLLGTLGSIVGFKDIFLIFIYSSICGLFLGLIWIVCRPGHLKFLITTGQILPTVDKKEKVPYGIAILLGTILYIIFRSNIVKIFGFNF